jgi:hypothetical protein
MGAFHFWDGDIPQPEIVAPEAGARHSVRQFLIIGPYAFAKDRPLRHIHC